MKREITFILILSVPAAGLFAQTGPLQARQNRQVLSRLNYYTNEDTAEIIVDMAGNRFRSLDLSIYREGKLLSGPFPLESGRTLWPVPLASLRESPLPKGLLPEGRQIFLCRFSRGGKLVDSVSVEILKLPHRSNGVKIDRMTGGLVVNGLPFFPFGFYCYSPVISQPEEEAVHGFNVISPYQTNSPLTIEERKSYMDRCADLGLKVHYHLLDLVHGGGVLDERHHAFRSDDLRKVLLKKEVETFRHHPALLAWYISDEPVGHGISPEALWSEYLLIRELDPYHPVSIVFMTPHRAKDYSDAMDIVMADPYPIPGKPVSVVGNVARLLYRDFELVKPVWIVPQAFGGNEWWEREPAANEIRIMTYLGIIHHATGIQYFIRHGPNRFPKSTGSWNECGVIAREIAELTPFLLSEEPSPPLRTIPRTVETGSWTYCGRRLLIAVNTENRPARLELLLPDPPYSGQAGALFENRVIDVDHGRIEDYIDGYGTRIYLIPSSPDSTPVPGGSENLISDPSFEMALDPGVPPTCYAGRNGERGSTYFIDSRTAFHGEHSLRLVSPGGSGGIELSFYPVDCTPGRGYTFSLYGKTDAMSLERIRERPSGFLRNLFRRLSPGKHELTFRMTLGETSKTFTLGPEWKRYELSFVTSGEAGSSRLSPSLRLIRKGTAWFDLLGVHPDPMISVTPGPFKGVTVRLATVTQNAELHYTLDGSDPDPGSPVYRDPVRMTGSGWITAGILVDDTMRAVVRERVQIHHGVGQKAVYGNAFSSLYPGSGETHLNDGLSASVDYRDKRWQGFEGADLLVTFDLSKPEVLHRISANFLQDTRAWIFLPSSVSFYLSLDGRKFRTLKSLGNTVSPGKEGPLTQSFAFSSTGERARYVRIRARNIKTCPSWHRGAGNQAWMFADEIVIE